MEQALGQELITDKSQLLNYFRAGIKAEADFKIGMEMERLVVNPPLYKAVPYSGGIEDFLKKFGNNYKKENDYIIGVSTDVGEISIEPGSQCEISTQPFKTIHELYDAVTFYNRRSACNADDAGFCLLGYGVQPVSTHHNIELIPRKRYSFMSDYLPEKGNLALVMMRETAGIQVSVDYKSEEDAINKLRVSLALSPVVTAMFANSPIRGRKDTGYKSYRALSWLNTDENRCGLVSKKLFTSEYTFEDHIDVLLDIPMIFIQRDHHYIDMKNFTFRKYLENGYEGYRATFEDWLLHTNLFFPDVRLNTYIEIRNCDSQREDLIFAPAALWKGILYDNDSMQAAFELVKDLNYEDLMKLRSLVPKYALDACVKSFKVSYAAKELVNIAYESLRRMGHKNINGSDESVYLDNLLNMVNESKCPADIILQKWYSDWNKNVANLADYSKIT